MRSVPNRAWNPALLAAALFALGASGCAVPRSAGANGNGSDGVPPPLENAASSGTGNPAAVRVREIYVPYEEFLAIVESRGGRDGIVMGLPEYRELLAKAALGLRKAERAELPPLASSVIEGRYQGSLSGKSVRFRATLSVRVATDGWARCDLGPPIPTLGSILVDDAPGWVVVENGRAYLLLKGKGAHEVELAYTAFVSESEDRSTLEAPLVPAASSRVELVIPGALEATSDPPVLETIAGAEATRLILAAGSAPSFRIDWRRRKSFGEQPVFLAAEHRVSFVPREASPIFLWSARVTAARRKVGQLRFREPPSARVLSVSGPLVRSWERGAEGLSVTLAEETIGEIEISFAGILEPPSNRYVLGPPSLADSFSDTAFLALWEPAGSEIAVESAEGAREAAPGEAGALPVPEASEAACVRPRLSKVFAAGSSEARVTVVERPLAPRYEAHGALLATATESQVLLEGIVRIDVRDGRLQRLSILIPAPWSLLSAAEIARGGRALHGLRQEAREIEAGTRLDFVLEKAAPIGDSLELRIQLEHRGFDDVRSWETREFEIAVPQVEGAERVRWDLGIAIPTSMDAALGDVPGWRSLDPEEMARFGLSGARPGGGVRLVAGLASREPEARLALALLKRPPRGEYRAVTHLLALERLARVRTDIRVTIVDRPIESLAIRLPAWGAAAPVILGPGIKEIESAAAGERRIVRFARPWIGTQEYRVEFETEIRPESAVPFPDVRVEPEGGKGFIGGERFIVLQSQGPVEIIPELGEGLSAVDVDELPDLGLPWPGGRILTAYRFHARGSPGTFRTLVHERAPVLGRLARTLSLSTVLGADGVSRTRAEILLAYSRDQHFTVELPPDARCLAVTVNGEPVRAVIVAAPGASAAPPEGPKAFRIPLPPQSYATVSITYERPAGGKAGGDLSPRRLGTLGTWVERAPRLPDIPVGETRWVVLHPEGYRFFLRGRELRAVDPLAEERDATFAESFFGRILSGRLPVFTTFLPVGPRGPSVEVPELTPEEARGAQLPEGEQATGRGPLKAKGPEAAERAPRSAAPLFRLRPEGLPIEAAKLGGDAEIRLFYVTEAWWKFSKKTVFFSTILLGLFLFVRRSRRDFARFALGGLFLGTLVPLATDWKSPLLLVPFSEASVALLAFAGGAALFGRARALLEKRRAAAVAAMFVLALAALAAEAPPAEPPARLPDDGVLIPYDPEALPGAFGAEEKVYVPYPRFLELWRLAHPEETPPEAPPAEIVLGNASYTLRLEDEAARISGALDIQVLTDRWTKIPLPFDRAQLTSVRIDGREAGVGQLPGGPSPGAAAQAVPFVELKGAGTRRLELELLAAIRKEPGEFRVLAGLLAGSAATLRAELPAGARVEARRAPSQGDPSPLPVIASEERGLTTATVDLGSADRIEIVWSFPKIEGESGSQVDSVSYSRLDLGREGYAIERLERVRVTGRKVDSLQYAVEGNWRVIDVAGADVAEWSVLRDAGERARERLQVFFAKPVDAAILKIRGRALLEASGPLAALSLVGAVKQETFVGLRHSADRRFAADVLAGMERASRQDLLRIFPEIPEAELPDRIYHTYGSGAGLALAAEPVASEAAIETDLVLVLLPDRLVLSARSRYSVTGPGPLRHEVPIPAEWSVRSVRAAPLRDWEVAREGGSTRLVVSFADRIASGAEVLWSAERLLASGPPERLEIPPLGASAPGARAVRESQRWAFAASEEFDLSVLEAGRLVPVSLDPVPRWIEIPGTASYRFGLRTPRAAPAEGGGPTPALGVARRPSRLGAVVVAFVRVAEDAIETNARAIFRIRGAGRDRFRLALPAGAELVSIETLNERSRSVREGEAGTVLEIALRSPASGEHAVDVSFRVPREAGSAPTVLPVRIFDGTDPLADVDYYVGVLQTAAATFRAASTVGLARAEPETLPYLPEGVAAASLQPTFRATQADWKLVLAEEEIQVAPGPAAIVELAELTTVVGRDGTARTRAVYTLRNRALQFLIAELPAGADLWSVTINGSPVAVGEAGDPGAAPAPRARGRALRIPVERVGAAGLSLEVAIQYEERRLGLPAIYGREALQAPKIRGTEVVETIWNLYFPAEYWLRMSGGNLREVAPSAQFASKLGNLLEQYQRVVQAGAEPGSRRQREQQARDLAQLERVLGDNLVQLELTSRSAAEREQADRLGAAVLEEQRARNEALLARSQEALRDARKRREEAAQAQVPLSKGEQAFLDTENFLKQAWRGGKEAKRVPEPAQAPAGGISLDALLEESPFEGLKGLALSPAPGAPELASPAPIDEKAGLKPLPESLIAAAAPGLAALPDAAGCQPYTFLRAGGDAELAISFTRRDAGGRLAAIVLLLALPAAGLWIWRRRAAGGRTRA